MKTAGASVLAIFWASALAAPASMDMSEDMMSTERFGQAPSDNMVARDEESLLANVPLVGGTVDGLVDGLVPGGLDGVTGTLSGLTGSLTKPKILPRDDEGLLEIVPLGSTVEGLLDGVTGSVLPGGVSGATGGILRRGEEGLLETIPLGSTVEGLLDGVTGSVLPGGVSGATGGILRRALAARQLGGALNGVTGAVQGATGGLTGGAAGGAAGPTLATIIGAVSKIIGAIGDKVPELKDPAQAVTKAISDFADAAKKVDPSKLTSGADDKKGN